MYNLLLVDDEPFITNGLKIVFQEQMAEIVDVYIANNGVEAIKWLNKIRIDIILSDISMPGMDGLELQRIVKNKLPSCKIIFLSAYDHIDYVKPALMGDAVDYMIKTCKDEEIVHTVAKTIKLIIKEEQEVRNALNQNDKKVLPLLKQDMCMGLIKGNMFTVEILNQKFKDFGMKFNACYPVRLMVARIDSGIATKTQINKWEHLFQVGSIFEQYLSKYLRLMWFVNQRREVVFLIQPQNADTITSENEIDLYVFITGMLKEIQKACKDIIHDSVSTAILKKDTTWMNISQKYEELVLNFNYTYGFEKELIMDEFYMNAQIEQQRNEYQRATQVSYKLQGFDDISNYLESNQLNEYKQKISEIIKVAEEDVAFNSKTAIEIFIKIASVIITYINKIQAWEYISTYVDFEKMTNMQSFEDWESVRKYFLKIGEYIIGSKHKKELENRQYIVDQVNLYIKEHIHEDTSLVSIAEHVNFNPYYLSRLYKQLSGENISDYVTAYRINKAKKMLKHINTPISKICEEVGFSEQAYFSRFFKKNTGLTPAQYRKMQLEKK